MAEQPVDPRTLLQQVRSKDPMYGLCNARQITEEGCDWVKYACDPFHDLQLDNLKGFPDVATEPTVIVKVRQAIQVTAPPDQDQSKNWDCHIVLSPIDWAKPNGIGGTTAPDTGYNMTALHAPQGQATAVPPVGAGFLAPGGVSGQTHTGRLDGLLINSVPSDSNLGANMTYTPAHCPMTSAAGYQLQQINLDEFLDFDETDLGVYRLLYSGFEVVNTTAQIRKQGAVTVYEYGNSFETAQCHGDWEKIPTSTPYVSSECRATNVFRSPPNTLAEAKIMPGSHTWAAQEGCYCTAKFQTDNPFQGVTQRNYILQQNNPTAPSLSGYGQGGVGVYPYGSFASMGLISSEMENHTPATHFSRMSTTGAYFTGLSPETTFIITWRVGLERLPAANKPTFLALAQPSASYDPNALVLYNLICNSLPPGCPQGYNDAGRWFSMVSNVAKKVIPQAFPLVPAAQMMLGAMGRPGVAAAISTADKAARTIQAARQASKGAKPGSKPQNVPAIKNWGAPGQKGNKGVQQFSQMSGSGTGR